MNIIIISFIIQNNLFQGNDLLMLLNSANHRITGSTIVAYSVGNLKEYGVVGLDANGTVLSLEEKLDKPVIA